MPIIFSHDHRPPLTLGLLPPMAPGRIEPVSWYRHRILETQPWETRNCREITQGRMPWWAISTILCRMWFGSGLPLMKTPPSWFTLPWPRGVDTAPQKENKNIHIQRDFIQFKVSCNTDEILIWLDYATFAAFISIRSQFAHIIILTIFQGRFVPNSSWQDASKDPLRDAISYPRDTREDGTPHLDYS